jgi:hypothetical protein
MIAFDLCTEPLDVGPDRGFVEDDARRHVS